MVCGIYKISNLKNGKVYIGQSIDIAARWRRHRVDAFSNDKATYNYPLYRAIRKYGLENFSFDIIEECEKIQLNERERYYISLYDSVNNGYNQGFGGSNGGHFCKISKEQLQEIIVLLQTTELTNTQIGNKFDISENMVCGINTGKHWYNDNITYPIRQKTKTLKHNTDNVNVKTEIQNFSNLEQAKTTQKKKVSKCPDKDILLAMLLEKQSFTAVAKEFDVSDNAVRKWCKKHGLSTKSSDYRQQKIKIKTKPSDSSQPKSIFMLDKDTNEILQSFKSIADAERFLQIPHSNTHISQVCSGKRRSAYGYKWVYQDLTEQ